MDLLAAKTKMQRIEMDLMLEQSMGGETDGVNDYLKDTTMQNQLQKSYYRNLMRSL